MFSRGISAFGFDDGVLKHLAIEIDDGAVWVDGPGANVADNVVLLSERNFDVGVFSAFCREDLDAEIVVLGGKSRLVVEVDLAIELNRESAGCAGSAAL
jgi:hypothetical protein